MNEPTQPPPTTPVPTKPKRKRASTPRGPRTVDPEIKVLQEQHKLAVAALKGRRRSAGILNTILNKRLKRLTPDDQIKLWEALQQIVTPPLPLGAPAVHRVVNEARDVR